MLFTKIRKLLTNDRAPADCVEKRAFAAWEFIQDRQCLTITFNGIFSESDAVSLTKYLSQQFTLIDSNRKVPIICRCHNMTDYEAHARIVFQNFIQNHMDRICSIWIITSSKVIKYGGKLLSMFVNVPIKIVEEEAKIQL